MTTTVVTPVIADLTTEALAGTGVFDILMRANREHLDNEFKLNRIKGSEYSTVYLGSLEAVMTAALTFLLQRQKAALEAQLLEQQILLAQVEVDKATASLAQIQAQTNLVNQQTANALAELAIIQANALKVPAEVALITAQTDKVRAEITLIDKTILKSDEEIALLAQKTITERAQVSPTGVDPDSVIGKQKLLYSAQTSGFSRDAEQKAAKILVDSWSVRRTTDEGTQADGTNMLDNGTIGRVVNKMLTGVGA